MASTRLPRLVELLGLLTSRTGGTADDLAGGVGVWKRTLFRDLAALLAGQDSRAPESG